MRKPSVKKSIMGMTTSQVKRDIMRSIDPTYGKKGMGWIKNPKKAMYNYLYYRLTFGGLSGLDRMIRAEQRRKMKEFKPKVNEHIFTELHSTKGLICDIVRLLVWLRIIKIK